MASVLTLEEKMTDLLERVKKLESLIGSLDSRTIGLVRLGPRVDRLESVKETERHIESLSIGELRWPRKP